MPDNFQYQATLTGAGTSTPVLTRVVATFAGTNTSSLISMVYDACGNLASLSRETASGTATEVRDNASWSATERINSLNQIKRNDVTPVGGPTTTYRYTYNADGTTASKTDGTATWSYTWDSVGD